MGNAVSTQFEVKDQIASGGPSHLWKVSQATRRSTGQQTSVFLFDKNVMETLNPLSKGSAMLKKDQDRMCELLKKEAQTLSRLRHPSFLEVTEALNDSPLALAFATEPLLVGLSNVLGNYKNFEVANKGEFRERFELDEVEIQKGILQLIKGLEFLHANKYVHVCLSPESIYINSKGDWKIAGFSFSVHNTSGNASTSYYASDYPPFCCPSLDYVAPEIVLENRCETASDVWSLGCLIFAVFNGGSSPINSNNNTHYYQTKIDGVGSLDFDRAGIPPRLKGPLRQMLVRNPAHRLTIQEFEKSDFFDNILISTINFLETFVEKSQAQKVQFLKGLVRMLPQFSKKLLARKILPYLLNELKDPMMAPFILPNIFWISDQLSDNEFNVKVLPSLKSVFKLTDPPQAILLLLSRIDLFMKKCPSVETFRQDIMPLLYSALDVPVLQVQEMAVKMIPSILEKLDFTTIKSSLFPKIQNIFVSAKSLPVKIASLIAIHAMVKSLDKFTLIEKVVPILKGSKLREPALMVAILAVYDELAKHLDKEAIAMDILPELWKMCIDSVLNVTQFKKFMHHGVKYGYHEQHLPTYSTAPVINKYKTVATPTSIEYVVNAGLFYQLFNHTIALYIQLSNES
ncbi:hypothetical protein HDV05_007721 [Chytridiales sp. JEL 0842]|nr:hypothetical protein HDV05_007721 [Chytridiales sp. JEL 0842]